MGVAVKICVDDIFDQKYGKFFGVFEISTNQLFLTVL